MPRRPVTRRKNLPWRTVMLAGLRGSEQAPVMTRGLLYRLVSSGRPTLGAERSC